MFDQRRNVAEKIFVLITTTAAIVRPVAIPVAAEIDRDCVPNWKSQPGKRRQQESPAEALITNAVNEDRRVGISIAPLTIMNFQSIAAKEMMFRFRDDRITHATFFLYFRACSINCRT